MKLNTFNKCVLEEKAMDELHSLIVKRYFINEEDSVKDIQVLLERMELDLAAERERGGIDGKDVGKHDLAEFAGSSVGPGIKILQDITRGGGDDLTSDEVELAARTWAFLRDLLKRSASGLKEQIEITNIGKRYTKQDELKIRKSRQ